MDANGQPDAATVKQLETAAALPKVPLDPELLTPRDMKRARVMLDGRNPFELLDDPIDRIPLIIWCLRSRTDPAFTWEEAEDTPFSQVAGAGGEPPPPPGGTRGSRGPAAEPSKPSRSPKTRRAAASRSSSPPSTG